MANSTSPLNIGITIDLNSAPFSKGSEVALAQFLALERAAKKTSVAIDAETNKWGTAFERAASRTAKMNQRMNGLFTNLSQRLQKVTASFQSEVGKWPAIFKEAADAIRAATPGLVAAIKDLTLVFKEVLVQLERLAIVTTRSMNKLRSDVVTNAAGAAGGMNSLRGAIAGTSEEMYKLMRLSIVGMMLSSALKTIGGWGMKGAVLPSVEEASAFERKLLDIEFTLDAVGESIGSVKDKLIKFGEDSAFTMKGVQDGFLQLKRAGLDYVTSMAAMPTLHNIALFSDALDDTTDSARLLTSAMIQFNLHNDPQRVGDVYAAMVKTSKFEPTNVLPFMRSLSSLPKRYRTTMEEMFAVAGALSTGNLLPAQIGDRMKIFANSFDTIALSVKKLESIRTGTGLKGLFTSIGFTEEDINKTLPGLDLTKARKQYQTLVKGGAAALSGMNFYDESGQFKGYINALELAINGIKRLRTEEERNIVSMILFRTQAKDMIKIIEEFSNKAFKKPGEKDLTGIDALRAYEQYMHESKGSLETLADKVLNSWAGISKLLEGVWASIQVSFGEGILHTLKPLGQVLYWILTGISKFLRENAAATAVIASFVTGLSLLATALGTIGFALFGFIMSMTLTLYFTQTIGMGVLSLSKSLGVFYKTVNSVVMGMMPFGIGLGTIFTMLMLVSAAIVVFSVAYTKNIAGVREWTDALVGDIRLVKDALMIMNSEGSISMDMFKMLLGRGLYDIFRQLWLIGVELGKVWEKIKTTFSDWFKEIVPLFASIAKHVLHILGNLWKIFKAIFGIKSSTTFIAALGDAFVFVLKSILWVVKAAIWLVDVFISAVDWIITLVSKIDILRIALEGVAVYLLIISLISSVKLAVALGGLATKFIGLGLAAIFMGTALLPTIGFLLLFIATAVALSATLYVLSKTYDLFALKIGNNDYMGKVFSSWDGFRMLLNDILSIVGWLIKGLGELQSLTSLGTFGSGLIGLGTALENKADFMSAKYKMKIEATPENQARELNRKEREEKVWDLLEPFRRRDEKGEQAGWLGGWKNMFQDTMKAVLPMQNIYPQGTHFDMGEKSGSLRFQQDAYGLGGREDMSTQAGYDEQVRLNKIAEKYYGQGATMESMGRFGPMGQEAAPKFEVNIYGNVVNMEEFREIINQGVERQAEFMREQQERNMQQGL